MYELSYVTIRPMTQLRKGLSFVVSKAGTAGTSICIEDALKPVKLGAWLHAAVQAVLLDKRLGRDAGLRCKAILSEMGQIATA